MSERIIDQGADDAERVAELALRPKNLNEFVGQLRVRDQLDLLLSAARQRKATADHILFSGPPGLGKKGAQRLVLELKDKAAAFAGGKVGSNLATSNQVENALQGLGYSSKEAAAMLNQVVKEEKIDGLSAAQILKLALKSSGKQ